MEEDKIWEVMKRKEEKQRKARSGTQQSQSGEVTQSNQTGKIYGVRSTAALFSMLLCKVERIKLIRSANHDKIKQ